MARAKFLCGAYRQELKGEGEGSSRLLSLCPTPLDIHFHSYLFMFTFAFMYAPYNTHRSPYPHSLPLR